MKIDAVLYSYKNKNLRAVVESLVKNTTNEINIYVYDQHQFDRSALFTDTNVVYEHVFWDSIKSPCEYKGNIVDLSEADYILEISDDILVSPGWDEGLISFISNSNKVVSGNMAIEKISHTDFSIVVERKKSYGFELSNYIDRNFIFATNRALNKIRYPYYLKYYGEEEILSIDLFRSGSDIYSADYNLYEDIKDRSLEKRYVPFSKEHNYNKAVEIINGDTVGSDITFKRTREQFFDFHGISGAQISKLPYQTDDVLYDPNGLAFQDVDARKFISNVKAIY